MSSWQKQTDTWKTITQHSHTHNVTPAWGVETDGPSQFAGQPEEPKQQIPAPVNDQISKTGWRAIEEDTK